MKWLTRNWLIVLIIMAVLFLIFKTFETPIVDFWIGFKALFGTTNTTVLP